MNDQVAWHKIFFRNSIFGGKFRDFFSAFRRILSWFNTYVLQATCKKFWRARWMRWWKECKNLDHQITFRKVSSEVADVAEGNADDFFHERFALSNWVDVNWKFAFAPEVQVGQRLGLSDRLRSLGHLESDGSPWWWDGFQRISSAVALSNIQSSSRSGNKKPKHLGAYSLGACYL